jgi:hypothetical protein
MGERISDQDMGLVNNQPHSSSYPEASTSVDLLPDEAMQQAEEVMLSSLFSPTPSNVLEIANPEASQARFCVSHASELLNKSLLLSPVLLHQYLNHRINFFAYVSLFVLFKNLSYILL